MRGPFEAESNGDGLLLQSMDLSPFSNSHTFFSFLYSWIIWPLTLSKAGNSSSPSRRDSFSRLVSGVKGPPRAFQTSEVNMNVYMNVIICHICSIAFIASPRSVQFVISMHVDACCNCKILQAFGCCNICCRCLLWTPSTPSKVRAFISAEQAKKSWFFVGRIGRIATSSCFLEVELMCHTSLISLWPLAQQFTVGHSRSLGNGPAVQICTAWIDSYFSSSNRQWVSLQVEESIMEKVNQKNRGGMAAWPWPWVDFEGFIIPYPQLSQYLQINTLQ